MKYTSIVRNFEFISLLGLVVRTFSIKLNKVDSIHGCLLLEFFIIYIIYGIS